jgi:hypothetical protein
MAKGLIPLNIDEIPLDNSKSLKKALIATTRGMTVMPQSKCEIDRCIASFLIFAGLHVYQPYSISISELNDSRKSHRFMQHGYFSQKGGLLK